MKYVGIDIGGTSIKLGLIEDMTIRAVHHVTTMNNRVIQDTVTGVHDLLHSAGLTLQDIGGIGMTLPGPIFDNQVVFLPNIQLERLDVFQAFQDAFGTTPLRMLNDANAAALGEVATISPAVKDAVMLTIGTGLGGGIISNYQIVEGSFGQGGELGHVTIHSPFQFQCGCGKIDCAETILSAKGIRRLASKLPHAGKTKITKSSNVKQIFNYAKQGDAFALTVVDTWAFYMARLLHQLNAITNPSTFIFGGGVANAGEFMLERIQHAYETTTVWATASKVSLRLATLGNDAGMIGAVHALMQGLASTTSHEETR